MTFIPHTPEDERAMLAAIGADSIAALFDEIPRELLSPGLDLPSALGEMDIARLMSERAEADGRWLNFIGAGAYEHHIPAAVWQIATRGEYYTAYTPYQAEASQGTLQLLYEWQSMMATLTGMDVSNASLYDGATALAEAVLMALRAGKGEARRVLVPRSVHPFYRDALQAIVVAQGIEMVELPYCPERGITLAEAAQAELGRGAAALVVAQPNFFGAIEEVGALTDLAHAHGAYAIALANPLSLALLEAPGRWGARGADICCGEAQPFGIPLSGGGPYLGYIACRQALVRQMPGRIIGRTVDVDGRPGFALTLQAREQHIRRAKATSNICTNQGLMVTAATIYLALTGFEGLRRIASACHANTRALAERLGRIRGVARLFSTPVFHEVALRLPCPAARVIERLQADRMLAGYDLAQAYPALGDALLVCATETKTDDDLARFAYALARAVED